jgi:LEA14-like dessication related protein
MKNWLVIASLLFLLSSCLEFDDVKFKGIESVKFPKIDQKEILIDLNLKLDNPNNYKIKIKPSVLDVYIGGKLMGKVKIDEKFVIKRKQENSYSTQLICTLEDGVLFSLMKFATMTEISVRFKGRVKGTVYGISKKIDIDETKKMNGNIFNIFGKN